LSGTGAGINISGLTTNATAYSDSLADAGVTRIDVLVDACRQIRVNEYAATAILLHPTDAWKIKLTKDSTYNYIHPWIFMPNNQIVLDGIPVVITTAMTAGQFLVGDFRRGAQVFDRKQLTLEIAYQNEDNFVKGMVTIRVQERLALAIYRAKCFIYGGFTAALAQGTA
jgi:HK97 family phage major capsid protein